MADAPWRCSQCDTVNEPNANSCRSCGRWPSLFELERSADDEAPMPVEETYRRDAPQPEEFEVPVETLEPVGTGHDDTDVPPQEWPGPEDPLDRPTQGWPRVASWIVPILFLVYVVISIVSNR